MTGSRDYNELVHFDDHRHEALMGVWVVGDRLKKYARRFFAGRLASEAQFNVLMLLKYADHPLNQRELSERLFVDKSNLTGVAGRMEEAGLIERLDDPDDARTYRLVITPKGHAVMDEVEPIYRKRVHALMAAFSPKELADLTEFMGRMQRAVDKTPPDPSE